ncbi:MAG: pyridoxamine 5'-phosphate oxidase family protein [Candidatus Accumulibacter sp.]|jgi:uncharacterized pyridoxamine 5'-phosphate oxidase family protein|nr:pyridoxamine 5'-phosphate oxidase family protein [Accumulibacter sp.]
MNMIEEYKEILGKTNEIALATSVHDVPNVRIVSFCLDPERPDVLLFATDRENRKVVEFAQNRRVAFTSIPHGGIAHVRSVQAVVEKSAYSLKDVERLFVSTIPDYAETIAAIGDTLDVFEIHVREATIVTGYEKPDSIVF